MDVAFQIEALEVAMRRHGRSEIVNTGQGGRFTNPRFAQLPPDATVKVLMGGRARRMDNVMIEQSWRTLKDERACLHGFNTGSAARAGVGSWTSLHNIERPHSALAG